MVEDIKIGPAFWAGPTAIKVSPVLDRMSQKRPSTKKPVAKFAADDGQIFLKARPLASRLGVSAKTILRWASAGRITPRKITARTTLFSVSEVLAFINDGRTTSGGRAK